MLKGTVMCSQYGLNDCVRASKEIPETIQSLDCSSQNDGCLTNFGTTKAQISTKRVKQNSFCERPYERELQGLRELLANGLQQHEPKAINSFIKFKAPLCKSQRPKYQMDGNRGCIKDEGSKSAKVFFEWTGIHLPRWCAVVVHLKREGISQAAPYFEPYICENKTEHFGEELDINGTRAVVLFQQMNMDFNEISFDVIGIMRKGEADQTSRVKKLEKECQVACDLFIIDLEFTGVVCYGRAVSNTIWCDQTPGRPTILKLRTSDNKILLIKGRNFKDCSRVLFRGEKDVFGEVIQEMVTKEFLACYIPYDSLVTDIEHQNINVKVKVCVDEKESDPVDFSLDTSANFTHDIDVTFENPMTSTIASYFTDFKDCDDELHRSGDHIADPAWDNSVLNYEDSYPEQCNNDPTSGNQHTLI